MIPFLIKKKEKENGIHSLSTKSMKRVVSIQL